MASTQDIRRRIKSVKNIEQITKAMKMVAAARLRRAQSRAIASKPYTEKISEVLRNVAANAGDAVNPLLAVREVKRTGYLILSADKGLAGAYSSNLFKEVVPRITDKSKASFLTVGRKARDYFRRRQYSVDREYTGFSDKPTFLDAGEIAKAVAEGYISGKYDEIYMAYTEFHSPLVQKPAIIKLLPLSDYAAGEQHETHDYIFEPSAAQVMDLLLPKYVETAIYGALLQSAASELGARMTAMGSATDNAEELIAKLVLNYNKVRQANITREITEIVGGAEALK
ncbi:MAG: ATP synthase F1 subunit gamma [Pelosinus sp.]|nr:ATP synthase F1 subunit gamma [Pelosinus sp.]